MFRVSHISLNRILKSSDGTRLYSNQLIQDYLVAEPALKEFYNYGASLASFKQVLADKATESIDRMSLVSVLEKQYAEYEDAPANIKLLKESTTYTITTGHQICLFTGPLYFIYKIITTINLTEQLKSTYPDKNFVPLYWMASEDHDFEEINHANVYSKTIRWDDFQDGPVGEYATKSLQSVLGEMSELLGDGNNAAKMMELFNAAYANHDNLADATRYLVHQLFGKYGLVVLDPDTRELKQQIASIMEDDLVNHTIYEKVVRTSAELQKKYKLLVKPREVNLFYIKNGKRKRIDVDKDNFKIDENVVTREEILNELASNPERFSPNVILRTIYQEKVLPNLAYIGGPGEIAYWLQFKGAFASYRINFPMLVLRNSAFIIAKNLSGKMNKLGVTVDNLFQGTDELVEQFIASADEAETSLDSESAELEAWYDKLKIKAEAVDKSLVNAVGAERQRALSGLRNIEKKMLKARKRKHDASINQIENIKGKLFPSNSLQERHDNISQYLALFGMELIDQLKVNMEPFVAGVTVLEEED